MSIENRMQAILALILRAQFAKDKRALLEEANTELDVLRFQVRLAKDLKVLPITSQEHAVALMLDIGAQLGGWIKACKT